MLIKHQRFVKTAHNWADLTSFFDVVTPYVGSGEVYLSVTGRDGILVASVSCDLSTKSSVCEFCRMMSDLIEQGF